MKEIDHPWIKVLFDENEFVLKYENPEEDNWIKTFSWKDIVKICFKSYDYGAPNFLYIFFEDNNYNCIIPIHENGGEDFWVEIKNRKLFNPKYAITADTSVSQYHCWPRD